MTIPLQKLHIVISYYKTITQPVLSLCNEIVTLTIKNIGLSQHVQSGIETVVRLSGNVGFFNKKKGGDESVIASRIGAIY